LLLIAIAAHAALGQQTDPQVTNLDTDTEDSIAQFEKSFDKILKSSEKQASKAEDPVEEFEKELKELPAATPKPQDDAAESSDDAAVVPSTQHTSDDEEKSAADGNSEANRELPKVSANKPDDGNKALKAELKRGWGALAGAAGSIPPPPPEGSSYLRMLNYSKTDGKCRTPQNLLVHGDFPETPKPKKKYCFPEAWNMTIGDTSVLMTVSLNCENYCNTDETAEDTDAPVVSQCTLKFYDPNRKDHECKEQDKISEQKDIKLNRAITTEGDKESGCIQGLDDGEITSHNAMRCHNCCGGTGQLAAAWLVILAAVLSNLYAQ